MEAKEGRKAKIGSEEKIQSPIPPFPARTPGTHAEHAATRARMLWACVIRDFVGDGPAQAVGMNRRSPESSPRPENTQPEKARLVTR